MIIVKYDSNMLHIYIYTTAHIQIQYDNNIYINTYTPAGCGSVPSSAPVTPNVPCALSLQALTMHQEAVSQGQAEAHDAVLASLQCMQALTSGGGGMDAAIATPGFVACLCSVLDPNDQDCSKLVVEMLTKLCLYSVQGYCAALQVSLPA